MQFQLFESDPINPSYETKRILLPHQVDESCISSGQFIWPFIITPPLVLSSSSSGHSDLSLGHLLPRGHCNVPKVQLIVTIHRRGRLTRNVGYVHPPLSFNKHIFTVGFRLSQSILYIPLTVPSPTSSPSLISTELPSSNSGESRDLPVDLSWPEQKFPRVAVRGAMFGQVPVEVECRVCKEKNTKFAYLDLTLVFS